MAEIGRMKHTLTIRVSRAEYLKTQLLASDTQLKFSKQNPLLLSKTIHNKMF